MHRLWHSFQAVWEGWQVELTDKWLRLGNPWEIPRPEIFFDVKFGGRTEGYHQNGEYRVRWIPDRVVRGTAFDIPVLGYQVNTVNLLRLYSSLRESLLDYRNSLV